MSPIEETLVFIYETTCCNVTFQISIPVFSRIQFFWVGTLCHWIFVSWC